MSWVKRHLPTKRWNRVALYVLSGLLILIAADMCFVQYWRRITISPETTRITTPLTPLGYPDYIAALNAEFSRGVTSENNAAVLLLDLIPENENDFSLKLRQAELAALSLPASPARQGTAVWTFDIWRAQQLGTSPMPPSATAPAPASDDDEISELMRSPWRPVDHPLAKKWLDDHVSALDLVHRAVARDRCYFPLVAHPNWATDDSPGQLIAVLIPHLSHCRTAAYMLITRAMCRLSEGDLPGFEQDITDTFLLARLLSQNPMLIDQLVAYQIDALAQRALQQASASDLLDAAAAPRLLALLDRLPPMPALARAIDHSERYSVLDFVCLVSYRGPSAIAILDAESTFSTQPGSTLAQYLLPINCNAALRIANAFLDRCVRALDQPTYLQQQAALAAIEKDLQDMNRNALRINLAERFVAMLMVSFTHINSTYEQSLVLHNLTILALQLRLYHLEHHAYPAALTDLSVPPATLFDAFADRPLVYRREGSGYLLYSVDRDGHDDGGLPRKLAKSGQTWDLVVHAQPQPQPK